MTGYTVNTGSTQKFSEGWDRIFSVAPKSKSAKSRSSRSSSASGGANGGKRASKTKKST